MKVSNKVNLLVVAILGAGSLICNSVFALGLPGLLPAIFGPDDRDEVTSTQYPWKAIGKLTWTDGTFCTGALIDRCHVLTAAHCVIDPVSHQLTYNVITFQGSNNGPIAAVTHVRWGTSYVEQDLNGDWAIVKLDKNLGEQLGWFGIENWQGTDNHLHTDMIVAGYSNDLYSGNELTEDAHANIYNTTSENLMKLDANATHGASGSPIWHWGAGSNNPRIVGVFTRSAAGHFSQYSDKLADIGVASAQFLPAANQMIAEGCD